METLFFLITLWFVIDDVYHFVKKITNKKKPEMTIEEVVDTSTAFGMAPLPVQTKISQLIEAFGIYFVILKFVFLAWAIYGILFMHQTTLILAYCSVNLLIVLSALVHKGSDKINSRFGLITQFMQVAIMGLILLQWK